MDNAFDSASAQIMQEAETSHKKATLDIQTDNEFEKKLLAEVIPPGEVGIGFDDIGALNNVKSTLREVLELASRGRCLVSAGRHERNAAACLCAL